MSPCSVSQDLGDHYSLSLSKSTHTRHGAALHALKKYDEALAVYNKGLVIAPADTGLLSGKSDVTKAKNAASKTHELVYNAISSNAVELLRKYHEKGIDITVCSNGEIKDFPSINAAAQEGHCDVIRLLHEVGADVNTANKMVLLLC